MAKLNVLITTVGALTSPDIIRSIRDNGERQIRIVGVDPVEYAVGRNFVDKFYPVVFSGDDEKGFISSLLKIVEKEKVDILVPCGNEDNIAIAKNRGKFKVKVLASGYDNLRRAFDKGKVLTALKNRLPDFAPDFSIVNDYNGFLRAIKRLGYPKEKVVVKPRLGRGGRGVYTLSGKFNYETVFRSKPSGEMPLEFFAKILKNKRHFEDLIVMEYLNSPFYSVYSLRNAGDNIISITHIREWGNASQTFRGRVYYDPDIEKFSASVNGLFGLDFLTNMELAETRDKRIVLFDLNPRIGASCGIDKAIGLNLPYLAIKALLGEKVSIDKKGFRRPRTFVRYFDSVWIND